MSRARLVCVALVVGVLAACSRPTPAVGVLLPRTGPLAAWGQQTLDGIQLALQQLPPDQRRVLIVEDEGGNPVTAADLSS